MAILKNTSSPSISVDYFNVKQSFFKNIEGVTEILDLENNTLPQAEAFGSSEPIYFIEETATISPFGKVTYFIVDANKQNITLSLPDLQQYLESMYLVIRRLDSTNNTITIKASEVDQTIDNQTSYTINTKPSFALIIVNKDNKWYII